MAIRETVLARRHVLYAIPIYKGISYTGDDLWTNIDVRSLRLVKTYYKVKYKIDDKICYALVYGSDGRTVFKTGCCRFL